ncbi:galactokinase [Spirosomataceae bacterium TFI 002]|nr:galactokinase [Spirosomataceae bacterium TFI 002]
MSYLDKITTGFKDVFGHKPELTVRAPGRVNLLGEHTDYNGGFVLPAAIDKAIYFSIAKRDDDKVELFAFDLGEKVSTSLDDLVKNKKSWANFLIGVMAVLKSKGHQFSQGVNVCFGGDVPLGAGLSSSAAVESGMGTALNILFDLGLSKKEIALTAQQAEHEFAGVKCGIMDMYASVFGEKGSLIKLDCKSIEHTYLPFELKSHSVILFDTGVKHNLGDSEYNKRREECESGVSLLQKYYTGIEFLRDVSEEQLNAHKAEFDETVYKRCKYVVDETSRMRNATNLLEQNNLKAFGQLMFQTHRGLQHEYEVSCPELDFLVDQVDGNEAVLGARMMGGGFGGCTINIIDNESVDRITDQLAQAYKDAFGIDLKSYKVAITNGCEAV